MNSTKDRVYTVAYTKTINKFKRKLYTKIENQAWSEISRTVWSGVRDQILIGFWEQFGDNDA